MTSPIHHLLDGLAARCRSLLGRRVAYSIATDYSRYFVLLLQMSRRTCKIITFTMRTPVSAKYEIRRVPSRLFDCMISLRVIKENEWLFYFKMDKITENLKKCVMILILRTFIQKIFVDLLSR